MRTVTPESRVWWGIVLAAMLLAAGALSTWYWYSSRPQPLSLIHI